MLIGKYKNLAELIGTENAEKMYLADIASAKKRDKIRRLKEKLLKMSAEDVGTACLHIIAEQCGIFDQTQPADPVGNAEYIIFQIQALEMEC